MMVAVLCGWTLVWVALWGAALYAVAGFFSGLLTGSSVGMGIAPSSPASVGLIAAPLDAVLGAVAGFIYVYTHVTDARSIGSTIRAGVLIALGITVIATVGEPWTMQLRGYRRLADREIDHVEYLLDGVCTSMRLRSLPRILVSDNVIPDAWVYARHVILTTGALSLPTGQLSAFIAHELACYRRRDGLIDRFIWALAFPVVVLVNVRTLLVGERSVGFRLVTALLLWPAMFISRFLIAPCDMRRTWACEFAADARVADAGYGQGMIQLLHNLRVFDPAQTGAGRSRPPVELRIEALQRRMRSY
jgi:Zn-dependent protease with chaperone function